jgi:biotin carboxyl carrier protein
MRPPILLSLGFVFLILLGVDGLHAAESLFATRSPEPMVASPEANAPTTNQQSSPSAPLLVFPAGVTLPTASNGQLSAAVKAAIYSDSDHASAIVASTLEEICKGVRVVPQKLPSKASASRVAMVNVKQGQTVKAGQPLAILSLDGKMMAFTATADGVIQSISLVAGSTPDLSSPAAVIYQPSSQSSGAIRQVILAACTAAPSSIVQIVTAATKSAPDYRDLIVQTASEALPAQAAEIAAAAPPAQTAPNSSPIGDEAKGTNSQAAETSSTQPPTNTPSPVEGAKATNTQAAEVSAAPTSQLNLRNTPSLADGAKDTDNKMPSSVATVNPTIKPLPVDEPPNLDQAPEKMAETAPASPSENVTLNLINRLVQRGILTKDDAGDLIRQAQDDARNASQQAQIAQQAVTQAAAAQQMAVEAAAPPQSDDQVSVSYVPEIVKSEMKDEIKRDVIAAAQSEGWTQPNIPEWVSKFRPFMDFRFRYQGNYYPGSDTVTNSVETLDTLNFNAINTGTPMNIAQIPGGTYYGVGQYPYSIFPGTLAQTPTQNPPTYNTTQQREMMRIRFRFGADMNLGDNFTSGFRLGTGQNGSPVSENQTLGLPGTTSQGGNFSGYAIWLDRAFLKYELGDDPDRMAAVTFGRFDNPFYTPTTIMWANDIGFDGIAAQARYKVAKGVTPFATIGLFPYFNTDLNFASTAQPKNASYDKYLYSGQVGLDWKITKDLSYKGSVGYYYFQNAQGQVSTPMITPNTSAQGNTDNTRPSFAQRGNTYMELRNIQLQPAYYNDGTPTPAYNNGTANYYNPNNGNPPTIQNQYQYFGLITPFNILSANSRLEYRHWEPFVVSLSGEWDQNVAFNGAPLSAGPPDSQNPYNIPGPVNNLNSSGNFAGGNNAWITQLKVGSGALQKRWDWDFGIAYRYVESDAVIDGFCDSDFGGGGTNLKGWSIGGNLALSKNVFIGARWLNANGIAGPTYKADILQLDLNARF